MLYIGIIALIFFGDLLIKNKMEKEIVPDTEHQIGTRQPLLGGRIIIRNYHNEGAFLNLGEKKRRVVAFLSLFFSVAMVLYFILTLTTRGNVLLKTGLSLMLGGAFSNTYDRLKRKYVVDYISFASKSPRMGSVVYNISDFGIMLGALFLVLSQL